MLKLKTDTADQFVSHKELIDFAEEHASLLERCQKGEKRYANDLGWLHVDEWASARELERIKALAHTLRQKADTLVLIGVGGSNNSTRAVLTALGCPAATHVLYAGNTLAPWELNQVLVKLNDHDVVIDCVAKNFKTLEPGASFRLFRQYLVERYGTQEAASRIVCTGTIDSELHQLCKQEGYTFVPFATNVGGRYSALTAIHLLPLAFAGINIDAMVSAARTQEQLCCTLLPSNNEAFLYACLRQLLWDKGYRVELLSCYDTRLRGFGAWREQLFAESEGKDGKGLLPISACYSEQLHSLGQFVQDGPHHLFETFIDVLQPGPNDYLVLGSTDVPDGFSYLDTCDFWDINTTSFRATRAAHAQVLPCITLEMDRLDALHFGELFYWFAFACYASAELLGVNPFNQPGVEAYKQLMMRELKHL